MFDVAMVDVHVSYRIDGRLGGEFGCIRVVSICMRCWRRFSCDCLDREGNGIVSRDKVHFNAMYSGTVASRA